MRLPWWGLLYLLVGCAGAPIHPPRADAQLPVRGLIDHGLAELGAGRAESAAHWFNAALKRDPADPFAHAAVAGAYELQAHQGDRMARELAQVGYRQALRFDPDNVWAAYRLGFLVLEDGRPAEALEWLARAVAREPDAPWVLNALAVAAYLDGRLDLAREAIDRAVRKAGGVPAIERNAARIAAATADLRQWPSPPAGSSDAAPGTAGARRQPAAESDIGLVPATHTPFLPRGDSSGYSSTASGDEAARATMMAPIPRPAAGARARMAQIDVVLIRTEEIRTARRGFNLLEGLQVQFSSNRNLSRTDVGASTNSPDFDRVVTRSISFPAIAYSLNIANDQLDRADVLARPALVALDGQPANFFSGEEVSIPVTGNFSGALVDKKIGIELAVTPTFLDDDTVLLSVTAQRGFFNSAAAVPGQALRTTQQRVTTAVAVDFGQTLILSGLSESQTSRGRSGVPLLQDVPGAGLLFSRDWTEDFSKSVLILLTPRPTGATAAPEAPPSQSQGTVMTQALERHLRELAAESGSDRAAQALHHNPLFRPPQRRDMDLGEDPRERPEHFARLLRAQR